MTEPASSPPGAAPDGAGRPEGGVLTPLGLALLTLDGALLGAFGVGFTPIFVSGVPVPMGVVFTVLVLPWLVLRAGELDRRPGVAALPMAAWFLVVAVLAVVTPGGDVMVPLWWQSGALLLGGVAAGLWALRQVLDEEFGNG